jgi:hypothetical protein
VIFSFFYFFFGAARAPAVGQASRGGRSGRALERSAAEQLARCARDNSMNTMKTA